MMRTLGYVFSIILIGFMLPIRLSAQTDSSAAQPPSPPQHQGRFVDEDGDGYNDLAPDHDGDGIPNGLDPDYLQSEHQRGRGTFIDVDGDGINDYLMQQFRLGRFYRHQMGQPMDPQVPNQGDTPGRGAGMGSGPKPPEGHQTGPKQGQGQQDHGKKGGNQ